MARSAAGDKMMGTLMRLPARSRNLVQPLQGAVGYPYAVIPAEGSVGLSETQQKYAFLDQKHPVYTAWFDRWSANEARLAGGDDVIDELRRFEWETDTSEEGFYFKRQQEAIYTNFPDIFASAVTGHMLKLAPKPDQGWSVPNLGKVTGRSATPTQAEQVWYSVDNPSGAGAEWNQWWADVSKRAMATGHRWLYVEATKEASLNRAREQQGYRPYLVEFSPLDTYNWYINERDVLEFVIFRYADPGPLVINGYLAPPPINSRGYLVLVRAGCARLGPDFEQGGWFTFDALKRPLDYETWLDTAGEIPVTILYYQRSKGTPLRPAMSRPGTTELGQAAIAMMNMTSSANFNAWDAGGGVDYLNGIDEDAFAEVERLAKLGGRRLPLPPNSETDVVPTVSPSSLGAVQANVFKAREDAIWAAAVRLGIIEAAGQVGGSGNGSSGATAEATFSAAQGPRIVWFAQNLSVAQNNILRYFELRYGYTKPTGLTNWPSKFDLVPMVDRIRGFFETERLSGLRSKTVDSIAMTMAAEDKGLIVDPNQRAQVLKEYEEASDLAHQAAVAAANPNPTGVLGKPQGGKAAKQQADRLALQKAARTRGKGGRPGPQQRPVQPPAPGVKR